MTLSDHYGNALSTKSEAARDHYDLGVSVFLSGNYGAPDMFRNAIEADPAFALAHAGLARAAMMSGDAALAKSAIATADTLQKDAREAAHVATVAHLISGRPAQACAGVMAHVADHPRDAMVAQMCTNIFGLIGFSGEGSRESNLLAYTSALLPHYGEDWWMMSSHAVSLCETGQLAASNALMEQALALNPRNANGAHFKAHEQYESGETQAGRAYLSDWVSTYDDRAVLHGHLKWHLALWALHAGDESAMWEAVDSGVGPSTAQGLPINVLTDTAAILYRAELAGLPVAPERWQEVSDYALKFFPETGQNFADLHAGLSHAMAGQGARLAHIVDTAKGYAGDLVAPVSRAWGFIARQAWQEALEELTPIMHGAVRLGGSRAQRDLLELTYANVLMKLGLTQEAARSLRTRRPILADNTPLAAA